jgi:hypothetical protein
MFFREDFFKLVSHKQELPMAAMLVVPSERNTKMLYTTSYIVKISVPPSFSGEGFYNFSQSETRFAHGSHVFQAE